MKFLYFFIFLIIIGIVISKFTLQDKVSLSKSELDCQSQQWSSLYDNYWEKIIIGFLGTTVVTARDGSNLESQSYTLFAIPVSRAIINCDNGPSYKIPQGISSFEQCVQAGYPIMESNPRQCNVPDGKNFVEGTKILDWISFADTNQQFSFQYPENLTTKYITLVDWPPQIHILDKTYDCLEGGVEIDQTGHTSQHWVNNREYCVTKFSEGAAGSIYDKYVYETVVDNKTIDFTFTLRLVQCLNYDNPQQLECLNERDNFDIDPLIDKIILSFKFLD